MVLFSVIGACLVGGLLSMAVAGVSTLNLPERWLSRLIGFAAGVMLATALLDLLPEAFSSGVASEALFATLLGGIVAFFALQRAAIWRHAHGRRSGLPARVPLILLGDGVHNFADGAVIAAAFLTDPVLGMTTTLAVIAHEIPQEFGDFVLLREAGLSRRRALILNGLSSLASVAGGLIAFFVLAELKALLPYVLVVAAASFLYIAIADLLPMLQRESDGGISIWQGSTLLAGIALVKVSGHLLH